MAQDPMKTFSRNQEVDADSPHQFAEPAAEEKHLVARAEATRAAALKEMRRRILAGERPANLPPSQGQIEEELRTAEAAAPPAKLEGAVSAMTLTPAEEPESSAD